MKLLLVKPLPDDHLYSHFVRSLQAALLALGHEAVISDQSAYVAGGVAPAGPLAEDINASGCEAVISFGAFYGAASVEGGGSLFDALGVKFLGWLLDHPVLASASLARELKGRYAVYCNPNHLRFAQALKLPGRGLTLLPGAEPPREPLRPFADREWPLLVVATCNGPAVAPWDGLPDSAGKRLLLTVLQRLAGDKEASLIDAFNDASKKLSLGARLGVDPAFDDEIVAFLRQPLNYLRHVDRNETIRSLVEAGLPLAICGPGWLQLLGERANVTYLDRRVDFADLPDLYNSARCVLNLNAGNGACERAVSAALAGAAVVSDYSEPLDRLLKARDGVAFYNRARPGDVVQVVGRLLETDGAEAMAGQARARVSQDGSWRRRAQQIVDFLQRPSGV